MLLVSSRSPVRATGRLGMWPKASCIATGGTLAHFAFAFGFYARPLLAMSRVI